MQYIQANEEVEGMSCKDGNPKKKKATELQYLQRHPRMIQIDTRLVMSGSI
jgi:hypothetical protein